MKSERTKLTEQLDKVFSEFIRRRHAAHDGTVTCYTCGKRDHWKKMHAGHFMSRGKKSTRWHEQNVQVQCPACNIFRAGEQYKFAQQLDADHGQGTAEKLQYLSNQSGKYPTSELRLMIAKYRQKLRDLE